MAKKLLLVLSFLCVVSLPSCKESVKYVGKAKEPDKARPVAPQEPQIPKDHKEALDSIEEGGFSFLGSHVCIKATEGALWRCEAGVLKGGNFSHKIFSASEDPKILLIIHDEMPVSNYCIYEVPLKTQSDGRRVLRIGEMFYTPPTIPAKVFPVEYKGQKLYIMEPDFSYVKKTPDQSYYFGLHSTTTEMINPGFSFKY